MAVLVEYLWNQKKRYEGFNDIYENFRDVCKDDGESKTLGLCKPHSEAWNWAIFIETNSMESWHNLLDQFDSKLGKKCESITQNFFRVYQRFEYNPPPKTIHKMRFLNLELDVWEGIDVGIKEYFNAHVKMFDGLENIWFMGQYVPVNENYNWAHFYWYDTQRNFSEASEICYRAMGRPNRIKILVARTYELYSPLTTD